MAQIRVKGHAISRLEHNGERQRYESAWTVACECGGFTESHSTKEGAIEEHRWHKLQVIARNTEKVPGD